MFQFTHYTDRPVRLYLIRAANIMHVLAKCKFFSDFFTLLHYTVRM